jgi:hypothetical protein
LFQPLKPVENPQYNNARLPLLREFDGLCRATASPVAVPAEMRFRYCNQGNSANRCVRYPAERALASFRYDVVSYSDAGVELLMLEERDYSPFAWRRVVYRQDSDSLAPEMEDITTRAQIVAFCRTFLDQSGARTL